MYSFLLLIGVFNCTSFFTYMFLISHQFHIIGSIDHFNY